VPRRPNVLCLVTDQQRADHLGCAGNPVLRTPSIDALAAGGVRFERAYVNNPLCMPGRSTWFTGLTPRGHGVRTNGIPLRQDLPTLPGALAEAGYRTHSVGKLHLTPFMTPNGVDPATLDPRRFGETRALWHSGRLEGLPCPYYGLQSAEFVGGHGDGVFGDYVNWLERQQPGASALLAPEAGQPSPSGAEQSWTMALPQELHVNHWVAERSIAFLREQAAAETPFFLWCSFPDPHHPYCPPEPWAAQYDPAEVPLPTQREGELDELAPYFARIYRQGFQLSGRSQPTAVPERQMREIIARTYGMVSFVDHEVGRVLATLDELGLAEDTIVVYTSDHGDMMGDHGLQNKGPFHFEGLLRVPSIWRWPGRFPAGRVAAGLASHLDFAPTLLDLCGVPIPEGETPAYAEAPEQLPPWPGISLAPQLRGEADTLRRAVLVEDDEDYLGLRLRTVITERFKLTQYAGRDVDERYGELFDLERDPGELRNLYRVGEQAALRAHLREIMLDELILTDNRTPRRLSHA
jgi:arylsulfatase A-like enzyme